MNDLRERFDGWLQDDGPAALVGRDYLMPVEGPDAVIFPSTFAPTEDKTFKGGYNIDPVEGGGNVCLIDSVGSQANRIEPIFAKKAYAGLVPQIVITAGDKRINLLAAGHRAADAIVRCSALQQPLREAFKAAMKGDAEPLARLAPTSIVFGVWDSRDTQAKFPRLMASTIRAFNVSRLTRSAVYMPAAEYEKAGLVESPTDKKTQDAYAKRGFVHVPSSAAPGGIIAAGGIRRETALHLAALRLLTVGDDEQKTFTLRRYILGLALTAFTHLPESYLRQGCNLVPDTDKPREVRVVYGDGRREEVAVPHLQALDYAVATAQAFGLNAARTINFADQKGPDREIPFDQDLAKADLAGDDTGATSKAKRRSKQTE